ncbi:AAA family ATPase [Rhodococcus sp. WS4]|nr:AAA family ATPase [Rhodococcus sp. WS4]
MSNQTYDELFDDVVKLYLEGFNLLYPPDSDPENAKRRFEYAQNKLNAIGSPQADLIRAIAACEPGFQATAHQVREIYRNIHTFGDVSRAMFQKFDPDNFKRDADYSHYPNTLFTADFFGLELKITTVPDVHAAAAAVEILAGNFSAANEILSASPALSNAVHLTTAMLHFRASRWPDAVTAAEQFRYAPMVDDHDNVVVDGSGEPVANVLYQSLSLLISAVAYAHLGQNRTAKTQLLSVAGSDFIRIASEANRVLGLIERADGHEDVAQKYFETARAYTDSDELRVVAESRREVLTVTSAEMIDLRTTYWDVSTEPSLAKAQQVERDSAMSSLLADADAVLQRQIGMVDVKAQVDKLRAGVQFAQEMKRRGKDLPGRTNHLILSGPPGTGKTTIARVIAMIYAGLGVCRTDRIVETSRKDFIGIHEGKTGEKTEAVIASALGGVLFIDEAYDLIQDRNGNADPYGQEAVTNILLGMENHRDDLIVVIAGYEKDLRRFLATNEGFNSRFSEWIRFDTYAPQELADIAQVVAEGRHSVLEPAAHKAISTVTQERMVNVGDESGTGLIDKAGNGRFSRNIIEAAERNREMRLSMVNMAELTDEELMVLREEDVRPAVDAIIEQVR